MKHKVDVVVIGSGIGGLCCAALCARAGREVLLLEAHAQPGGAAHGFERRGYQFESGPSLWSGLARWPSNNPLAQILRALDQPLEVIPYNSWDVLLPEGDLRVPVGRSGFEAVVRDLRGSAAVDEWQRFSEQLQPIAAAANALPLLALRPGLDAMAQLLERGPQLLRHLPAMRHLSGAFGPLVDRHLQDPFLRHWVDLLCFLISGMPMGDTNAAAMATLFGDWFDPDASLDYPVGGCGRGGCPGAGLRRHGGSLRTQARVDQILVEDGRAVGVQLADGECIHADQVVSNADIWSTLDLLPDGVASSWRDDRAGTPACRGFLHLHLGFDASGLDDLPIHTVWVDDWDRGIAAERNAVVLSVPSVLDPGMAPQGRHVLHAYTPASEPWDLWRDQERGTAAYNALKQERCGVFWSVLERKIPDIRERCELVMEGTPLTHRHYLNVHQGSYGPALSAADGLFPGVTTPVEALWLCGAAHSPASVFLRWPPVAPSPPMASSAGRPSVRC